MEKPFGTDLESAKKLHARVHEVFDESQVFRIDHFLGKEAAQNILAFRFANGLFEPIWNRNFIDHVQIDVPETLGLEGRTKFYETTGAYRDMVVTHLMQVLAFTAMEPPTSLAPDPISDEKLKVFRSMRPIEPHHVVRGQYAGYRGKEEVADDSDTETFVALKVEIDNWRWAGVPFYLRTGKKLAEGARIISIAFKEPPLTMFPKGSNVGTQGPDHLTFDLAGRASRAYGTGDLHLETWDGTAWNLESVAAPCPISITSVVNTNSCWSFNVTAADAPSLLVPNASIAMAKPTP